MIISGHIPPRECEHTSNSKDLATAVAAFQRKFPRACIEDIDGVEVVGMCEACGLPIFKTDEGRTCDEDGICVCGACNSQGGG